MKANAFERHAQTALVLLLVALLIWVGNTTQLTAITVAEMRIEVAFLKAATAKPSEEYLECQKRMNDLTLRIRALETAMVKLEKTN